MVGKYEWRYIYFYKDMKGFYNDKKGNSFYFDIITANGKKMADIYAVQHALECDNYFPGSLTFVTKRRLGEK